MKGAHSATLGKTSYTAEVNPSQRTVTFTRSNPNDRYATFHVPLSLIVDLVPEVADDLSVSQLLQALASKAEKKGL